MVHMESDTDTVQLVSDLAVQPMLAALFRMVSANSDNPEGLLIDTSKALMTARMFRWRNFLPAR